MMYRIVLFSCFLAYSLFAASKTALLTGIARDTIVADFTDRKLYDKNALRKAYPYLAKDGATFVTLYENKRLRGCIGSLTAFRPLIDDLVANSRSAAFSDSRFLPLQRNALSHLEIEVSVLTPPERIRYDSIDALRNEVVAGRDGIILKTFLHKATFLPQVWEDIPDFEQFFAVLCEKAGLQKGCLKDHPDIYRYGVEKYSEAELVRRPMTNAGLFYPEECLKLEGQFAAFRNRAQHEKRELPKQMPRAIIVPHAGYVFSGYTADLVYRSALKSRAKRVILVGPSHHTYFTGISAFGGEAFATPCGILRSDTSYLEQLKQQFAVQDLDTLYKEHSTEVQLPFINHYMPEKKVIELVYGEITPQALFEMMQYLLKDPDNLVVVSSDLSHYYAQKEAHKRDFVCLHGVEALDVSILKHGCEACGYTGVEALVHAADTLGLQSELLDYRTSADTSGDRQHVVGYMGAIVW